MSLALCGWIEIQDYITNEWVGVIELTDPLLFGIDNRLMHSYLFGGYARENAGIFNKGMLPDDASPQSKRSATSHHPTWVTIHDIDAIKWKQRTVEDHIETYIDVGDLPYSPVLTIGYKILFDLMRTLSNYHGSEHVRLVVWFE